MGFQGEIQQLRDVNVNEQGIAQFAIFDGAPLKAGFSWGKNAPSMTGDGAIESKRTFLNKLGIATPPRVVLKSVRYNQDKIIVITNANIDKHLSGANGHGIQTHADVLVTNVSNLSLMVTPADCTVSVLFGQTPQGNSVLGMSHAGWRETIDLVPAYVVHVMEAMGCIPDEIHVAIAPSIMMDNFWVKEGDISEDERKRWGNRTMDDKVELDGDVIKLDVLGRVLDIMMGVGIKPYNVMAYAVDTFASALNGEAFSHRASLLKKEKSFDGRFAVAASLG